MFGADSLKHLVVFAARKCTQWVATQSMQAIAARDLVPELFDPNRSFAVALRQQRRRNLSADGDSITSSLRGLGWSCNQVIHHFPPTNGIRNIVDGQP